MLRIALTFLLLFLGIFSYSQRSSDHLIISGTVLGYTYDDTKSIFKKNKKNEIEGSLEGVAIVIENESGAEVVLDETKKGGEFSLKLETGQFYKFYFSKKGYGKSAFNIDLRDVSREYEKVGLVLKNIEVVLNNYESDKPQDNGVPFGTLKFNGQTEEFDFKVTEFEQKKRLFKNNEDNTLVNLMLRSLEKNVNSNKLAEVEHTESESKPLSNSAIIEEVDTTVIPADAYLESKKKELQISQVLNLFKEGIAASDIEQIGQEIDAARRALEKDRQNATTELDFLSIEAREQLLASAERELENAKSYIEIQDRKIEVQRRFLYAIIGVAILLLALSFFLWKSYQDKKKHHAILSKKDKKITDSLNYALKIQRSVLLSDKQIKEILPKSFVYYAPLDMVSGDFYWFSKVGGKTIIAAVDCTGHGVPGAFMSLIGNTLMNQIVNEKGITSPDKILQHLHEGIVNSLNQDQDMNSAQDGMDASVCVLSGDRKKLEFSGAMNSAYLLRNGEIQKLNADLRVIGGVFGRGRSTTFKKQEFDLEKGDRLYLFSDGYMDQFGGANDEKFNIGKFKDLITSQQNNPITDQSGTFEKALNDWKGNTPQTDDILVVGVEV